MASPGARVGAMIAIQGRSKAPKPPKLSPGFVQRQRQAGVIQAQSPGFNIGAKMAAPRPPQAPPPKVPRKIVRASFRQGALASGGGPLRYPRGY